MWCSYYTLCCNPKQYTKYWLLMFVTLINFIYSASIILSFVKKWWLTTCMLYFGAVLKVKFLLSLTEHFTTCNIFLFFRICHHATMLSPHWIKASNLHLLLVFVFCNWRCKSYDPYNDDKPLRAPKNHMVPMVTLLIFITCTFTYN